MNRRHFLLNAVSAACALPALSGAATAQANARARAIAGWKKRIDKILSRGRLPIIDMQATYVPTVTNIDFIMKHMDALDVAQIAFATAAPHSNPSLALHKRHPEFFIPTSRSGEIPFWARFPVRFVRTVARDLRSGSYYLMGEHEFRHYPSPEEVEAGRQDRDITVDIESPAGHALFALSEETRVAFQIHYEIEDRLLPGLEAMLARYPGARVIWCHLGLIRYPDRTKRYGPAYVASLIERFPNLHFDLATPGAHNVYAPSGAHDGTIYKYPSNKLKTEWRVLMEKHPERFLAASDYRPAVEQSYPEYIRFQHRLLQQLSPGIRQQVAFGNAWRLITGTPWSS